MLAYLTTSLAAAGVGAGLPPSINLKTANALCMSTPRRRACMTQCTEGLSRRRHHQRHAGQGGRDYVWFILFWLSKFIRINRRVPPSPSWLAELDSAWVGGGQMSLSGAAINIVVAVVVADPRIGAVAGQYGDVAATANSMRGFAIEEHPGDRIRKRLLAIRTVDITKGGARPESTRSSLIRRSRVAVIRHVAWS
jgi:hypothetical protein